MGGYGDGGIVDVGGVLEFDAEVVLPAVVDGGVGDGWARSFGGEGDAGAIEGEHVVGDDDAVGRHEGHQENAGDGKAWMDRVLVVADQADKGPAAGPADSGRRERVVACGKEQEAVRQGVGREQHGELPPGDPVG